MKIKVRKILFVFVILIFVGFVSCATSHRVTVEPKTWTIEWDPFLFK